jgi:hypothetical protein
MALYQKGLSVYPESPFLLLTRQHNMQARHAGLDPASSANLWMALKLHCVPRPRGNDSRWYVQLPV